MCAACCGRRAAHLDVALGIGMFEQRSSHRFLDPLAGSAHNLSQPATKSSC